MRYSRRRAAAVAVGLMTLVAATGCGSDPGGSDGGGKGPASQVDVGLAKPIEVRKDKLRIAYVPAGLAASLYVRQREGVEKAAKEHGATVKTFDPGYDATKQQNIYQNVISSGDYDVLITSPLVGQQACTILSKTAPAKGLLVGIVANPICGLETKPVKGDGQWAPGTLNFAGFIGNADGFKAVADKCATASGGGETILLNAASGTASFETMSDAYEAEDSLDIVANYHTNYTPEDAAAKVAASLRQNPDLKVIATTTPRLTDGAVRALETAGKIPGKDVFVCSILGGGDASLKLIKSGKVVVDNYANNYLVGVAETNAVFEAIEGKNPPRVISPGPEGQITAAGTEVWPPVITSENVDQFEPSGE